MKKIKEPLLEPLLREMRLKRVKYYIPKCSTLLDIGCGNSAAFLRSISSYIRHGIGVDFKVQFSQWKNITTKQIILSDYLPFENSSFDVVTMLAVLEHIEYEKEILQEVYRILVPGGKLIITVPSIWSQPILEFLAYRLRIVSEAEIRDHKRYYTRQLLEKLLIDEIGFQNFHHQYFQLGMNNFCTVTKGK